MWLRRPIYIFPACNRARSALHIKGHCQIRRNERAGGRATLAEDRVVWNLSKCDFAQSLGTYAEDAIESSKSLKEYIISRDPPHP